MPSAPTLALAWLLAGAIAWSAHRAGSLSRSGAVAAAVIGGVCMSAGTAWGLFLVLWFVTASLASRVGKGRKEHAMADVVAKGGRRDATQVFANGGVFAVCALLFVGSPTLRTTHGALLAVAGASALVAAGADTLATETGTLWRGLPFSLRTFTRVPTGTSGAVSVAGTAGMMLGAIVLAVAAAMCGVIPVEVVPVVAAAGVAGATADTVIGAWWQARRWCATCERETEQTVHTCGTTTTPSRGVRWLDNDVVNLACTMVGAAVGGLLVR